MPAFPSVEWFNAVRDAFNRDEQYHGGGAGACNAEVGVKVGDAVLCIGGTNRMPAVRNVYGADAGYTGTVDLFDRGDIVRDGLTGHIAERAHRGSAMGKRRFVGSSLESPRRRERQ